MSFSILLLLPSYVFIFKVYLKEIIYLTEPYLSCGTQDLQSSLQHMGSFSFDRQVLSCTWHSRSSSLIKPGPPALGAWSLSHWTTRKVPKVYLFLLSLFLLQCSSFLYGDPLPFL